MNCSIVQVDFDPDSAKTVIMSAKSRNLAAFKAVMRYCSCKGGGFDTKTAIIDLLTDLQHYARAHGLDVSWLMQTATDNFAFEVEEEERCRAMLESNGLIKCAADPVVQGGEGCQ